MTGRFPFEACEARRQCLPLQAIRGSTNETVADVRCDSGSAPDLGRATDGMSISRTELGSGHELLNCCLEL